MSQVFSEIRYTSAKNVYLAFEEGGGCNCKPSVLASLGSVEAGKEIAAFLATMKAKPELISAQIAKQAEKKSAAAIKEARQESLNDAKTAGKMARGMTLVADAAGVPAPMALQLARLEAILTDLHAINEAVSMDELRAAAAKLS